MMCAAETAKFNVDAKPFEMHVDVAPFVPSAAAAVAAGEGDGPLVASAAVAAKDADDDLLGAAFVGLDAGGDAGPQPQEEEDAAAAEQQQPPFEPPDDALKDRIVKQVEFYFSDVNLTKDAFLLKHVKRNKEGLVSLKLIASFKKVKALTKDWRAVAYSLRTSDKLVVNAAGSKVGRREPLPPYDESTPTRTVIAMNLPLERPSVEAVAELFGKCGEIALIRILRPQSQIPPDLKQFTAKHPGLGACVCAVIEFVTVEGAQRAVHDMGGMNNDWRSMHVVEMAKGTNLVGANGCPAAPPKGGGKETNGIGSKEGHHPGDMADNKRPTKGKRIGANNGPTNGNKKGQQTRPGNSSFSLSEGSSPEEIQSPRGRRKAHSVSLDCDDAMSISPSSSAGNSPWVQRRRLAAKESGQSPLVGGSNAPVMLPEGVLRMPRGPDGTQGFHYPRTLVGSNSNAVNVATVLTVESIALVAH